MRCRGWARIRTRRCITVLRPSRRARWRSRAIATLFRFLHTLLRRGRLLPEGDADFPGRWRAIKVAFSKSLPVDEPRSPVMTRRGERGIWQRRYWEYTIRDERDFATHMDYTHFNPVKHGLVGTRRIGRIRRFADAWPAGSIRRHGWAAAMSPKRPASSGEETGGDHSAAWDGSRRNALHFSVGVDGPTASGAKVRSSKTRTGDRP
jgi:hypothetical protein